MSIAQRILLASCLLYSPISVLAQDNGAPTTTVSQDSENKPAEAKSGDASSADAGNAQGGKSRAEQFREKDRAESPSYEEVEGKALYWMCKLRTDVRTLRLEAKNQYCQTKYSKEGNEKAVSQSKDIRDCYHVFANIRRNLEFGDFKCKDISGSRVSTSY